MRCGSRFSPTGPYPDGLPLSVYSPCCLACCSSCSEFWENTWLGFWRRFAGGLDLLSVRPWVFPSTAHSLHPPAWPPSISKSVARTERFCRIWHCWRCCKHYLGCGYAGGDFTPFTPLDPTVPRFL